MGWFFFARIIISSKLSLWGDLGKGFYVVYTSFGTMWSHSNVVSSDCRTDVDWEQCDKAIACSRSSSSCATY